MKNDPENNGLINEFDQSVDAVDKYWNFFFLFCLHKFVISQIFIIKTVLCVKKKRRKKSESQNRILFPKKFIDIDRLCQNAILNKL